MPRMENNGKLPGLQDKPVLELLLPLARVIAVLEPHIKSLDKKCDDHAHFD